MQVVQIPVLNDNYVYLIRDEASASTAVVDPSVAEPVLRELRLRHWQLDTVLVTHHHADHVGGIPELVEALPELRVMAFGPDAMRIPNVTEKCRDGDEVQVGTLQAEVIFVPGHTTGHIAYYFAEERALFCGDTLFAGGCGRLFEGTPKQMQASLERLRALPDDVTVYCAHEYTEANLVFAQTVEPGNDDLTQRISEVKRLRRVGRPTVPSTLALEKKTNPFLRWDHPEVMQYANEDAPVDVFAKVREAKDNF